MNRAIVDGLTADQALDKLIYYISIAEQKSNGPPLWKVELSHELVEDWFSLALHAKVGPKDTFWDKLEKWLG